MAQDLDGDLGVDVLIIGGGIQGLYLARALHKEYSVCVVTDPKAPSETLDASGFISAGYNGNDVNRIQPARRAAGYWRLWAESSGVPHDYSPAYYVMPVDEQGLRTRIWADATLAAKPAVALPQIFGRGTLDEQSAWLTEDDVVVNPGQVLAKLREGLEERIIYGEVNKFGVITDKAIDFVEVQTLDGQIVPITPRFVVLASNVGNGALLQRLVTTFKDRAKRRDAVEIMRNCQAVRRRATIMARGDLPLVSGHFAGLDITAHPVGVGLDHVWAISPPIDDRQTVLGPEEIRFEPKLEAHTVRDTLDRLFDISPEIERRAAELTWGGYVARKTEHPMMAVPDTTGVPQPAPARLENLDMEGFIAVWPSHLSYAMIVGDVVAERIQNALGPAGSWTEGLQPADVCEVNDAPPEKLVAHWERPDFTWNSWAAFTKLFDYGRGT